MSFDLFFFPKSTMDAMAGLELRIPSRNADQPANPEQEKEMQRLVDDVRAACPSTEYTESEKGFLYGCWLGYGDGYFPDMDVCPEYIFMSMKFGAVRWDSSVDESFREKVVTFFEERNYVAYDPQKGRIATSSNFSFGDDPPEVKNSMNGGVKALKPWWRFW
ncbi:MAG: hypothetical protein V4805_08230 [Pseudomonadota bacterium]